MMAEGNGNGGWSLDRHIPVALLLAIGIQTAGGFWWAATVTADMKALEYRIGKLETNTALTIAQGNQLAAVDAKMSAMQDSFKELKSLVMGAMASPIIPLQEKNRR